MLCLYPAAVILLANTVQGKIHVDGAYVGGKVQSEDKRILAQPKVGRRGKLLLYCCYYCVSS